MEKGKIRPNSVNPIPTLFESLPVVSFKDISFDLLPGGFSVHHLPAAYSFYQQIIEQTVRINSTVPQNQIKPLLFINTICHFLATVDLDPKTGKLETIKAGTTIEKQSYLSPNKSRYYENLDAAVTLLKSNGYTVIEINIPTYCLKDNDTSPRYCRWCGTILPTNQHKTKHFEFCPECKSIADRFLATYKAILKEWKRYRRYVAAGKTGKANSIKTKSKYAYLLDDVERFDYITSACDFKEAKDQKTGRKKEVMYRQYLPLVKIKQLLRPLYERKSITRYEPFAFVTDIKKIPKTKILLDCMLIDKNTEYIVKMNKRTQMQRNTQIMRNLLYRSMDSFEPANFDKNKYDTGDIGPYCPKCGNLIPNDKRIDSKYCSNECGDMVRNTRKKRR